MSFERHNGHFISYRLIGWSYNIMVKMYITILKLSTFMTSAVPSYQNSSWNKISCRTGDRS